MTERELEQQGKAGWAAQRAVLKNQIRLGLRVHVCMYVQLNSGGQRTASLPALTFYLFESGSLVHF